MRLGSIRLAGLAGAAVALLLGTSAQAATIAPTQACYRYAPSLAGHEWVGLTGSGFTPGTDPTLNGIRFQYPGPGSPEFAGFSPLGADGSFGTNVSMPLDFIDHRSGRIKRYTLTATDQTNPAITASTQLTFVRAGISTKPRHVRGNLHRLARWSVYGAPTGAKLYMHWTFHGHRYATRRLGRAKGSCGVARKRLPFLVGPTREGTWKVSVTRGPHLKRRGLLFRVDVHVI